VFVSKSFCFSTGLLLAVMFILGHRALFMLLNSLCFKVGTAALVQARGVASIRRRVAANEWTAAALDRLVQPAGCMQNSHTAMQ
jgi:hypothetical protein